MVGFPAEILVRASIKFQFCYRIKIQSGELVMFIFRWSLKGVINRNGNKKTWRWESDTKYYSVKYKNGTRIEELIEI